MRKIFLVLCAFLALALGVSAVDNEFKNMLINIDVDKISENAYKIDLLTQVPYVDEVKVVKKSDYHYYILLAETYSKPISKKIGDINPLEVQLFPYVEQGLSNGYTKITFNTTRPVDFTVSLKAKTASKYPIMDLVKLAKLDQMFAQNQTTVKGGKVLVASAPSTPVTTPVTTPAAKPTVAAATATPVSKPTAVAQTPIKEPERLPIEVKPLPKPIAPSNEMQSVPASGPPASVKVAQKPVVTAPAATPVAAAPKVESKTAPAQKATAPVKVAQAQQKQAAPARPVYSQPVAEPLYKPRKQAAHVPMAPPEGYEPVKPPVAQQPAVQQPVVQEPSPAPEPQQPVETIQQQEPEPIAAAPEPQPELTFMERLAISFENAKNNNPTLLTVLFLAIGLFMITLLRVASVNSNNKKIAQLAAQQKAQAEQEAQQMAQREQEARQRAQKKAQSAQTAQQMYTPPPMQPAAAPLVEPEVSRVEETVLQDVDVEEIMAQITPQDLAPEAPPQAQHVEVVELPPEAAPQAGEINLDDFETFEISFEEHSEQMETYESGAQSPEETFTREIVSQLAPQFDELPELELEADSEPVPQPVTFTFEDEFARPMGATGPSTEQPAAEEPQEPQRPREETREAVQEQESPRSAASEPLSLSSRPPRRTLRHRKSADSADILSKVTVEKDRGFYLADYQGVKALVGYIMDDIFVINTFKDKELKNPQIDFRLSESTHDGDYYLVRVDGSTMLVKSQKDEMSLASIMKPH